MTSPLSEDGSKAPTILLPPLMILNFWIIRWYDMEMSKDELFSRAGRKTAARLGGWSAETGVERPQPSQEDKRDPKSLRKDA
jgi:hypothetical protein